MTDRVRLRNTHQSRQIGKEDSDGARVAWDVFKEPGNGEQMSDRHAVASGEDW